MKTAHLIAVAALSGFVLSLAFSANAETKLAYATVVRIQGHARYSKGDNAWHPLTVGQTLDAGAVIQTGADSVVDTVLGDKIPEFVVPQPDKVSPAPDADIRDMVSYTAMAEQNGIRLYGDTVLAVDKLVASNTGVDDLTDTELDLRQGTIFGCVKKLSAASQFVIKMPNAAAAVRGTTFVLSANGVITVIAGSCVISAIVNGQTVTQVVNAGEQFDPATGQVTQLTQAQIVAAKRTAVEVITGVKGIISFEDDRTIVYVSPVHGNPGRGHHHWWWPF